MELNKLDTNLISFLKGILDINFEQDIIFIKDSDFKYIFVNERFCDIFDVALEDILCKSDESFIYNNEILENCCKSDKIAYIKGFFICEEKVFNKNYRVLKVKINIGNGRSGLLCFAKIKDKL